MLRKISVVIVGLFLFACTKPAPDSQSPVGMANNPGIFGGKDVQDNQFNGVVALIMFDRGSRQPTGICSGTLISETIILTAAHCVKGFPNSFLLGVSFAKNALTETSLQQLVRVEATEYHDRYNLSASKEMYDLGLVKIPRGSVPAGVHPVTLASAETGLRNGSKITVAGYGVNSALRNKGAGTLRTNKLKIDNANYSGFEFSVNQLMNGVCSGDSGGPAFVTGKNGELVQVGVVSRGFDLVVVKCIIETYFTRVDKFQEWILEASALLNRYGS